MQSRWKSRRKDFASSYRQVVVVESNYSHINIKKVLDFWHPVGCIAECGSGIDEFRPEIFNVRMAKAKTGLSLRAWRTQNGIKIR